MNAHHHPTLTRPDYTLASFELEAPGISARAVVVVDAETGSHVFAGLLSEYVRRANPWDLDLGALTRSGFALIGNPLEACRRIELREVECNATRSALRGFWFAARMTCEAALASAREDHRFELEAGAHIEAHWARVRLSDLEERARHIERRIYDLSGTNPRH